MAPRRVRIGSAEAAGNPAQVPGTAPEGRGRRRRSPTGRLGRLVAGLVVLAGIAYGAVAVALELLLDPQEVASWLAPRASAALSREVSVGEARFVLLPRPGIVVSDLLVQNVPGWDGPELAAADELRLDLALLPLVLGQVRIHRVRLDRPALHLALMEDGASNFGDLIPERPRPLEASSDAPVRFGLRAIELSDARLTYTDGTADRALALGGAGLRAEVAPDGEGGWTLTATGAADSLHARAPALGVETVHTAGPSGVLTLRGTPSLERIEIVEGRLDQLGLPLAVRGHLADLDGVRPSLELELSNAAVDADVLLAALSPEARETLRPDASGSIAVRLLLRTPGLGGGGPDVHGSARIDGVGLALRGVPVLEDLHGRIGLAPDTISLDSLGGRFAGGPLEASGTVYGPDRAWLVVVRARPDLDVLDRAGLGPRDATLSGALGFDVSLAGSFEAPEEVAVGGVAELVGLRLSGARWGVPIYVPSARIALRQGEARWSEVTVMAGEDRLVTTGRLEHPLKLGAAGAIAPVGTGAGGPRARFDATLAGPRLDLDALLPASSMDSSTTYAHLAFAHLGGRAVGDRPAEQVAADVGLSRPERPPVPGTLGLQIDSLRYRIYDLEDVRARIELTDEAMAVEDASFGIWGGRGVGTLRVGLGAAPAAPFDLDLGFTGVEARPFFARMTPVGEAVDGALDLTLTVSGSTDRTLLPVPGGLTGGGRLEVSDGRLAGTGLNHALADFISIETWTDVPFERWTTTFDVRDDALDVRASSLRGPLGSAEAKGLIRLEGATDLSVALAIPATELTSVSLRRTGLGPGVLERLRAARAPLELGLRVSGTLTGPVLEPDALAVGPPGP